MSGLKASQAFAAFRQSVTTELTNQVFDKLVPNFNAEAADIRKGYDDAIEVANEAPTDAAKNRLIELAANTKKARIFDLVRRKNAFIDGLNVRMKLEIKERLDEYKGETYEEEEEDPRNKGKKRKVTKVKFPDGSIAKVPQGLFVDSKLFQRI